MARSIAQIQAQIISSVQSTPELAVASSPSRRAIWRLWTYVIAAAMAIFEQLQDVYSAALEDISAAAPPGTALWIQRQVFLFQYDPATPQIVQLNTNTFAPSYPLVNAALRIVTRCSVTSDVAYIVRVKVAKGAIPQALSTSEVAALQGYMNTIGFAGITYYVTSAPPDNIMIGADVYYQGQYSAIILASIAAAVTTFLSTIPFNGIVKLSDIEAVIRTVPGVNDVVLKNVSARASTTPYTGAMALINGGTELLRQWQTIAGYIIPETTATHTLADTLNLIAE